MSIQDTIDSIETNVNNSYDAVDDLGGTVPQNKNLENLPSAIRTIPVATLGTKSITANGTYTASTDSLDGYSSVTVSVPSDNPLIATTDAEMNALLVSANNGKVAKFTGTSSTYETNTYYVIEESV